MIRPPFTILILKQPRRPVTIRVSVLSFCLACAGIAVAAGLIGFGALSFFSPGVRGIAGTNAVQQSPGVTAVPGGMEKGAEIGDLFVSFAKNGGMDVSFTLGGVPPETKVYVWVVINPDSPSPGRSFIHPRGPVFRGYPLDFRNGVLVDPSHGRACTVSITEGLEGIAADGIRLLVYSTDGTLLVDKRFTIAR